jgi:hypothetical protein
MFRQSHGKYGVAWDEQSQKSFCIMKLYAQYYGAPSGRYGPYRYQSLDAAGRQCGICLPNAHRAQADTLLARAVLNYIAGCED